MATTGSPASSRRHLVDRYHHLREDQLRYMEKMGLVKLERGDDGVLHYGFADHALIRQADAELADGATFRAIIKNLLASRHGQLTFDFRLEAQPAKVLKLKRREPPPMTALLHPAGDPIADPAANAEQYFVAASILDNGDPANVDEASTAYRRALEIDPYLVPALINLANLHYSRDEIAEAQALYERAISLESDVFEAHFNLGNILHDLGRYTKAQGCYREALRLNPAYADAHFYLAVTLEKSGQSQEARPHWRAYQHLAPNGEWVELAREFSD